MKSITQIAILLLILMLSNNVSGQSGSIPLSTDSIESKSMLTKDLILSSDYPSPPTFSSILQSGNYTTNTLTIFNKDTTTVLLINQDGTVFYTPKYFCRCKSCLKAKGMKKLNYKK